MNAFFINYKSGFRAETAVVPVVDGGASLYRLAEADWAQIESVEWRMHDFEIAAGDEGYFLVAASSTVNRQYGIGFYRARPDGEYAVSDAIMPLYGLKHGDLCRAVIVTGMPFDVTQVIKICGGRYSLSLRFAIDGRAPDEPICLRVLDNHDPAADYCDMARHYRAYQLAHGFAPLREKLTPALRYGMEAPNIRVRMGWKPVPTPVAEQTPETEPPLHVACTFDDLIALMDEFRAAGIEKAEFCLVGWNCKGHDGRWPQALPVEEAFGGEEGLRRLLVHARACGYAVNAHVNLTDAYSIADCFDREDTLVRADGQLSISAPHWAGGRTYERCPRTAFEKADELLEPTQQLGFFGTYYIDVISAVPTRACYHPKHPISRRQCAEYWSGILANARRRFGAVASEGAFDHSLAACDGALYVSFLDYKNREKEQLPVCDEDVPMWQLVYHGIMFSTPFGRSLNSILSPDPDDTLKVIEYGGRPQFYYYAHFVSDGSDWLSRSDFACHTPEARRHCAEKLRETLDIFEPLNHLQYEFMEKHEKIADGVYAVTYSDGSVVTVDYNAKTYALKKEKNA